MPGRNHPDGPISKTPGAAPKYGAFRPLQQTAFSSLEHAAFLERAFCSGLMKSGAVAASLATGLVTQDEMPDRLPCSRAHSRQVRSTTCFRIYGSRFNHAKLDARTH